MRRDAKGAEALLPRINAGAPTARQKRRPEASGTKCKIQIPTEKQVNPIPQELRSTAMSSTRVLSSSQILNNFQA